MFREIEWQFINKKTETHTHGIDSSVHYLSVLQDSQPLQGHEKEQREVFYFEI